MNELSDELKTFLVGRIADGCDELTPKVDLQKDLGVYGDEASEFLEEYGKKFEVDLTEFYADEYFRSEGDTILPTIIRFLLRRKAPKYFPLTLGDLERGIKEKKLR